MSGAQVTSLYGAGACKLSCGDAVYTATLASLGAAASWSMDEVGATFVDSIGGRNGAAQGSFTKGVAGLVAGGKAAKFTGAGSVTVPYDALWSSPSFSVAAWVTSDGMAGSTRDIVSTRTAPNSPYNGWELRVGLSTNLQFDVGSNNAEALLTGPVASPGQPYFVVGTYDAATKTSSFYVNGVVKATQANAAFTGTISPLDLGRIVNGDNLYLGVEDGVACFKEALGAADVARLYSAGSCQSARAAAAPRAPAGAEGRRRSRSRRGRVRRGSRA